MSSVLALMLATFTVAQGDAFRLDYPHLDGLEKIEVGWRDRTVPLVRSGDRWVAIIGVDLDRGAGDHPAPVTFTYTDGRTEVRRETVRVTPKEFPLTRLTVEPRFVELNPEDLARANRESARLGQVFAEVTPGIYWSRGSRLERSRFRAVGAATSAIGACSTISRATRIRAPIFRQPKARPSVPRTAGGSPRPAIIFSMGTP